MNTYEAKQAARKARYEARAGQAQTQSDAVASQASRMAGVIPMGQPILVGHLSLFTSLDGFLLEFDQGT